MKKEIKFALAVSNESDREKILLNYLEGYLAVRFARATLKAQSLDEVKRLKELWDSITEEK